MTTKRLVRAGIIAAVYVAITYLLAPISYGYIQFRVSEAMTILPIILPEAVPALFVGVLLANILGGLGLLDIVFGSLTTLVAAIVTYKYRHKRWIAFLSPIVFNAVFISLYLHVLLEVPYWLSVLTVGAGEAGVVFLIGYPLLELLKKQLDSE